MDIERKAPPRFAAERQRLTLEKLKARGRLEASDLAQEFNVTSETVRRDLDALAELGLVRRVHGGAIPVDQNNTIPDLGARTGQMFAEKQWIAAAAAKLLPEFGAVFLDAGSTTLPMTPFVPQFADLTIVTNSLPLASALAVRGGPKVQTLGGVVRGSALAEVGPWAMQNLESLHLDLAIIATSGVSLDHAFSTATSSEAVIKRAVIRSARRVVVVCDHTKIGSNFFERFAELTDVDVLITDVGARPEQIEALRAAGIEVVVAGPNLEEPEVSAGAFSSETVSGA